MSNPKAQRNDINILYSIGTILAVFGHSHPNGGFGYEGSILNQIIIFVYTFHMPLFFVIAGMLLYGSRSLKDKSYGAFIKEKALKLLTPYFVLTTLFLIPKGFIEYGSFEFLNFEYVLKAFFSPRHNTWGHFWFLPVLFLCYIIAGAVKKLIVKTDEKFMPIILFTFMLLTSVLMIKPVSTDWLGLKDLSYNLFYLQFGMMIAFCEEHLKIHIKNPFKIIIAVLLFALSVVAFIFNYNIFKNLITGCMLLALILFAKSLGKIGEKLFAFTAKHIFTVYIYSWIFQSIVLMALTRLNVSLCILALTMFVLGLGLPLFVAIIYKKLKFLNCKFLDLCLGMR